MMNCLELPNLLMMKLRKLCHNNNPFVYFLIKIEFDIHWNLYNNNKFHHNGTSLSYCPIRLLW
jgi:hypothetical protein